MPLIKNDPNQFKTLIKCLILVSKLNQYTWEKQINRFMNDNENVAQFINQFTAKKSDVLLKDSQISHFIYYLMSPTTMFDQLTVNRCYIPHPYFNVLLRLNEFLKLDNKDSCFLSESEILDVYWAYLLVLKKWLNNKESKSVVTRFSDNHTRHLKQVKWLVNLCYKTYVQQTKFFNQELIRSEIYCFSKLCPIESKLVDSKLTELNRDFNHNWDHFVYNLNKKIGDNIQIHYIRKLSIESDSLSILGVAFINENLPDDIDIKPLFEEASITLNQAISIPPCFLEKRYVIQNLEDLTQAEALDRKKELQQHVIGQKKQLLDELSTILDIDSDLIQQLDYVKNGDQGISKRHRKSFFSSSHKL